MTIIRNAAPGDALRIAQVHVASWRSTYPTMLPPRYLLGLSEERLQRQWYAMLIDEAIRLGQGTVVADDSPNGLVGFGSYGAQRTRLDGYAGEFYTLYLLDDAKGLGLGRRLMAAMAERLLEVGTRSAIVWCLRDNPARWFYERLGGQRIGERPTHFAGTDLVEIAYGWRDLVPLARMSADPGVR